MNEVNSVLIAQDRLECWVRHQNKLTSCNYEIPQSYWLSIYPHIKEDQIKLPLCDCRVTFEQICCLNTRKCQECDKVGQMLQMSCRVMKDKFTFTCFQCIQKDGEKDIQKRKNYSQNHKAYIAKILLMQKQIGQNINRNCQLEQQLGILRNQLKNLEQSLTQSKQNQNLANEKFKSTLQDYHSQNATLMILEKELEIQQRNVGELESRLSQLTDERQQMERMLDQKNNYIEQITLKIDDLEKQIENQIQLQQNQKQCLKNDVYQFSSQNSQSFKGSLVGIVCQRNQPIPSDFQMSYHKDSSEFELKESSNEHQSDTNSIKTQDLNVEQQPCIEHKPQVTRTLDFAKKKTIQQPIYQSKKKTSSVNLVKIASQIYQTAPLTLKKQATVEVQQQRHVSHYQQVRISNPTSSSAITDTSEIHSYPISPQNSNSNGQSDVQTQSNTGSNSEFTQSNLSFSC